MATVSLRLRGGLEDRLDGGKGLFEVAQGTTLGAFLAEHDLDARHYVVMLNNVVSPSRETLLNDGDRMVIYPQMAGG